MEMCNYIVCIISIDIIISIDELESIIPVSPPIVNKKINPIDHKRVEV